MSTKGIINCVGGDQTLERGEREKNLKSLFRCITPAFGFHRCWNAFRLRISFVLFFCHSLSTLAREKTIKLLQRESERHGKKAENFVFPLSLSNWEMFLSTSISKNPSSFVYDIPRMFYTMIPRSDSQVHSQVLLDEEMYREKETFLFSWNVLIFFSSA